jgi:hypothetical protein
MVIVVAVLLGLLAGKAFGVEPPPGKMDRQIEVMEKILDQVLIDSPNFLVQGRGNARGLYVKEFGVIVTFGASLVDKDRDWSFDFSEGFKVVEDEKGRKVIILEDTDEETAREAEAELKRREAEEKSSRGESVQARLYKRGKAELVDTLLDYGDTVTTLGKGQWVALVAFLQDARYFDERGMSKLVLKARIDDLRLYATDKLSEEDMVKRIVEMEY